MTCCDAIKCVGPAARRRLSNKLAAPGSASTGPWSRRRDKPAASGRTWARFDRNYVTGLGIAVAGRGRTSHPLLPGPGRGRPWKVPIGPSRGPWPSATRARPRTPGALRARGRRRTEAARLQRPGGPWMRFVHGAAGCCGTKRLRMNLYTENTRRGGPVAARAGQKRPPHRALAVAASGMGNCGRQHVKGPLAIRLGAACSMQAAWKVRRPRWGCANQHGARVPLLGLRAPPAHAQLAAHEGGGTASMHGPAHLVYTPCI